MPKRNFDFDVIYVNYFSYEDLIFSLNSFLKSFSHKDLSFSIKILDNSYSEVSSKKIEYLISFLKSNQSKNLNLEYVPSSKNIGFGEGCNKAARLGNADKILFLNCDTDLANLDVDKFIKFSKCINERDVIGGPKVVDEKNFLQASCFSFDPLSILLKPLRHVRKMGRLSKLILKIKWIKKRLDLLIYEKLARNSISYVDWISGCFMLVNRKFFESIGGFDKRYFLYFEDVDLCRSAKEANFRVFFDPRIEIIHKARHQSSSKKGIINSILSNKTARYHIWSWINYMWKWKKDFKKLFD